MKGATIRCLECNEQRNYRLFKIKQQMKGPIIKGYKSFDNIFYDPVFKNDNSSLLVSPNLNFSKTECLVQQLINCKVLRLLVDDCLSYSVLGVFGFKMLSEYSLFNFHHSLSQ